MPCVQRWPAAHSRSAQLFTHVPPRQYWSLAHVTPEHGFVTHVPPTHDWFAVHMFGNVTQLFGWQQPSATPPGHGRHTSLVAHVTPWQTGTQRCSFAFEGSGFAMHFCGSPFVAGPQVSP